MKVQQVRETLNPFGGIHFVIKQCKQQGIDRFINEQLGCRSQQAEYSYSDGLLALSYSHLCGASCCEDINTLRKHIGYYPGLQQPSTDTVLRIMQELKVNNTVIDNDGVLHQFNYNEKLNDFLQKLALKTGLLNTTEAYTLDYDNVIQENEKYDATTTYKMTTGYQPAMAAIGKNVVFVEGRNGNTPACYKMARTLKQCFETFKKNGIQIKHFRSDSAAYQKEVVQQAEKYCRYFYIRIDESQNLRDAIKDIPEHHWQSITLGYQKVQVACSPFFPFEGKQAYRAVVQRRERENKQADIFTGTAYSYYAVLTNNEKDTAEWITRFYNERGASERNFDILNNDFNCNRLPFSFLDANTVYTILAAMSSILFEWIKKVFAYRGVIKDGAMRIKKFLFDFMLLPAKCIKTARQWVLKIYTTRTHYEPLLE
jgi:peroxiredoxin